MHKGRFLVMDWQGKAKGYMQALEDDGWRETLSFNLADFILTDMDVLGRRALVEEAYKKGKPVFIYPHAARPLTQWDGMFEPWEHLTAQFVIADGHAEVMRRYGYPHPLEVTGWTYCEQREFKPTDCRRVLLGPNHPNANGWLSEVDRETNRMAFLLLLKMVENGLIELTVQHLDSIEANGLWTDPRVKYLRSQPNQSTETIDRHDVIVSTQTLAYLAIARGKPTVMMNENIPPHCGNAEETFCYAAKWEHYQDLMMFPLDILQTKDPFALLQKACQTDQQIAEWRKNFIGQPFDAGRFVETLEGYLEVEHGPILEPNL